jgi:hypothetical protein
MLGHIQGHRASTLYCQLARLNPDYSSTGQNGWHDYSSAWEIIQNHKTLPYSRTCQSLFLSQTSLAKLYGPALVCHISAPLSPVPRSEGRK